MKVILKNFLFVLKRFKTSSILNILGLSVAFAVFSVIIIQVYYDFSYDRNFKKTGNIYEFNQLFIADNISGITMSTPMAQKISDKFPEVKSYCITSWVNPTTFDVTDRSGKKHKVAASINKTTVGFLNLFTPTILFGNPRPALTEKGKALISENTAKKFFGQADPIGKTIVEHESQQLLTVVAVYKDFPKNCSVATDIYTYLPDDEPTNFSYKGYFEVEKNNVKPLLRKLNSRLFYDAETWNSFSKDPKSRRVAKLTPLPQMHFWSLESSNTGSLTTTLSLLAIGILTLVIAYINFLNFAIAMAPTRVRGLNIRRILGASIQTIRFTIISEAILFSAVAFAISLLWVILFNESSLDHYFSADLSILANRGTLLIIASLSLVTGLTAGLYPAHYILPFRSQGTSVSAFSTRTKNRKLQNGLIMLQFTAATALIIISSFITMQNRYMQHYSWGIQKENIVYLPTKFKTDIKTFGEELKRNPRILDYTASQFVPGDVGMQWGRDFEGKQVNFTAWPVQYNFLPFFGIPVTEGTNFKESDNHKIILNRQFLKTFALKDIIGKKVPGFTDTLAIAGIAKNVNYSSLRDSILPMGFMLLDKQPLGWIFLKLSGKDMPSTVDFIKKSWKKYSDEDFDLRFLDQSMDELYKTETNLANLLSLFGIVIVIIAIMGVYGLISFHTRYRLKEIALRKVNGASAKEIMLLLNRNMLLQLSVSFIIAVPIAYYVVYRWLQQFAYKIPVYWWVFLLAGILVFVVTVATVTMQSYRAASANPADAIRGE